MNSTKEVKFNLTPRKLITAKEMRDSNNQEQHQSAFDNLDQDTKHQADTSLTKQVTMFGEEINKLPYLIEQLNKQLKMAAV